MIAMPRHKGTRSHVGLHFEAAAGTHQLHHSTAQQQSLCAVFQTHQFHALDDAAKRRLMLADRLAGKSDFDCQRELRTMELLKLRFGESNMHNAEIMLGVSAAVCNMATIS